MIKNQQAFPATGRFYRGNLHCHSTQSDGQATPEQRMQEYREAGYDFLAITDHKFYSDFAGCSDDNFLMLPGVELDCGPNGAEALGYHTVGIGLPGKNTIPVGRITDCGDTVAEQIAYLNAHGNFAIAAHPYWLRMTAEAFRQLDGVVGLEVYNTVCDVLFGTGFSEGYWDEATLHGMYPLAFASDDYHTAFRNPNPDHFMGYIKVKADALTHEAITDAILAGHFYASHAGPDIFSFEIRDGKAIVETAPCRQIRLISPRTTGAAVNAFDDTLTRAEFALGGGERVIRAVVTDAAGHDSWTQILPVEAE